jgi:ADP-ribose pyrophosphatase YjhB (NUDIX family)
MLSQTETLNLRRGIDFIGITVVFFCHDGNGHLLMHRRSAKCRDEHGCWDVGGGAMELGESFEGAVQREIFEEYCTRPKSLEFIEAKNIIRQKDGLMTHWIALLFVAELERDQVEIGDPEKMQELGWFSPDALPLPLHSKFQDCFEVVKKRSSSFST